MAKIGLHGQFIFLEATEQSYFIGRLKAFNTCCLRVPKSDAWYHRHCYFGFSFDIPPLPVNFTRLVEASIMLAGI